MVTRNARRKCTGQTSLTAPVVTDATAPELLGMSSRQFREAITRQHVPHMKLGQRTVVFFTDLRDMAHRNATIDAHAESRGRHHQRVAGATEGDDFWASVEHFDERDAVNALLGRVGRQLTDEAYRNYYKERKP